MGAPAAARLGWLARGEGDLPAADGWLAPAEAARAAGMRFTKRRTEYLVARWTGKLAVAGRLGLAADAASLARLEVRNAPSGAPEVHLDGRPAGVGVSLTDRAGWAVCVVGAAPAEVGCDLELVETRSPGFVADFLTPAERRLVAAAGTDLDRAVVANLIWSATECALKVLRTGLRRDTRSVEVLGLPARGCADRAGWQPLAVRVHGGAELPGWWLRCGSFLLTVAGAGLAAPPVSMEDPPALVAATPGHGWLNRPRWSGGGQPPQLGPSRPR